MYITRAAKLVDIIYHSEKLDVLFCGGYFANNKAELVKETLINHPSLWINHQFTICTSGLSCSGPGCVPVWSLGKPRSWRPLAPASLEPDWTGWLMPAAHSLRIKSEMQMREETTKLLLVSIITLWQDPIWLLSWPEKNTPSDNYCEIMSGRQAF